jgi:hypothetical protein
MLSQLVSDRVWAYDNCIDEQDKASYQFENIVYVFRCKKRIPKKGVSVEDKTVKKIKKAGPKQGSLTGSAIEEDQPITEEDLRFYSEQDELLFNVSLELLKNFNF